MKKLLIFSAVALVVMFYVLTANASTYVVMNYVSSSGTGANAISNGQWIQTCNGQGGYFWNSTSSGYVYKVTLNSQNVDNNADFTVQYFINGVFKAESSHFTGNGTGYFNTTTEANTSLENFPICFRLVNYSSTPETPFTWDYMGSIIAYKVEASTFTPPPPNKTYKFHKKVIFKKGVIFK